MDDDQQFCLRWNNHQSTLISVFDTLLENGTLVDCTLAAEGKFLKAHKVVLSACSPYFAALLSQQYDKHPIFILKDVKFQELRAMMDYMYRGEVNISQDQLAALLKAAESLQIKGLSDSRGGSASSQKSEATTSKTLQPQVPVNKASGLTIENKRPLKSLGTDLLDTDISGSREGSTSPTSRKRKKIRRKSLESNNLIDNHDQHSNSSSQSLQTHAVTSLANQSSTSVAITNNNATSLSVPSSNVANIKKTENIHQHQQQQQSDVLKHMKHQQPDDVDDDGNDEDDENMNNSDTENEQEGQPRLKDMKSLNQSELMIEPKNEYDDGNDENVEDLTLDDEELLDEMDQPGPSHGGEGSSQGYAQWQMERAQDEAFMGQEGGQHRDAQDILPLKGKGKDNSNIVTARKHEKPVAKLENQTSSIVQAIASAAAAAAAESQSQTMNKKIVKLTHPRIKYSKHKNPQILQPTALPTSMVIPVVSQHQAIIQAPESNTPTKIELLNFSLTRKPGGNLSTSHIHIPTVKQLNRYSTTEYETSTSNTSQSNDFPSAIMDELDYSVIDDIELPDDVQVNFGDSFGKSTHMQTSSLDRNMDQSDDIRMELKAAKNETNVLSTIEDKYALLANTSIMKNFEYTVNDKSVSDNEENDARQYICRHCNKRYRWKSTLRRHENVECGGKEASHQCPYCNYKAKQRGNLGVHIRKHHTDMPQLESRRKKNRESM